MDNKNKWILLFLGLALFLMLILILNKGSTDKGQNTNSSLNKLKVIDNFPNVSEPHWTHMPITYKILNPKDCREFDIQEIKKALSLVQSSTDNIYFEEVDENLVDIYFNCFSSNRSSEIYEIEKKINEVMECKNLTFNYSKRSINPLREEYLNSTSQLLVPGKTTSIKITDEISIWEICYANFSEIGISRYEYDLIYADYEYILAHALPIINDGIIINGTIDIYLKEHKPKCSSGFPLKEVHEILHLFGFEHIVSTSYIESSSFFFYSWGNPYVFNIMYPYQDCTQQESINEEYISCLNYIYSNGRIFGDCSEVIMYEDFQEETSTIKPKEKGK